MTILFLPWRVAIAVAFGPFDQVDLPSPDVTVWVVGTASCSSMSNMAAGVTFVSTVPVICHCHVKVGST